MKTKRPFPFPKATVAERAMAFDLLQAAEHIDKFKALQALLIARRSLKPDNQLVKTKP